MDIGGGTLSLLLLGTTCSLATLYYFLRSNWLPANASAPHKRGAIKPGVPPPLEARIACIKPQHGTTAQQGFYLVKFVVDTDGGYYLLSAPEIVQRCTHHQQPIPYSVAADPLVNADIPLFTGDALLESN